MILNRTAIMTIPNSHVTFKILHIDVLKIIKINLYSINIICLYAMIQYNNGPL